MPPLAPQLSAVAALASAELKPLWVLPPAQIESALFDVLPATVDTYAAAASTTAANWYDNERERAGVKGYFQAVIQALGDLGAYALAGWATEPLRAEVPDVAAAQARAEAGLQTRITNSGNGTVTDSALADPQARGYIRLTSAGACDFCRMVASRGAVFSESTARFACHDDCNCYARPAWGGEAVKVYQYRPSQRYLGMSPAAAAEARAKLNEGARAWIKNNREIINAQTPDAPTPAPRVPKVSKDPQNLDKGRKVPKVPKVPADKAPKDRTAPPAPVDAAAAKAAEQQAIADWLDAEDAHQHSVEYWRRVDEENLHSIPPAIADDVAELEPVQLTPMDRAVADFEKAVESGDEARIDAAIAAMEKLEAQERKAAAADAAKAAKSAAESDRILTLIDEGWDPAEAEAEVTGKTVEQIRRRDFIAQARAEGHAGAGFDDLLTSVHQRMVDELAIEAENATRGQMVKRRYMLQVSAKQLWSVNDTTARKWMSEEMAAWFDEHGRMTRSMLREMILSGYSGRRFAATSRDYLQ